MPSVSCHVSFRFGGEVSESQSWDKDVIRIGRLPELELCIDEPSLEPIHAIIDQTGEHPVLCNASEASTVSVQGKIHERLVLTEEHTTISLGRVVLHISVVTNAKNRYEDFPEQGDAVLYMEPIKVVQSYQKGQRDFVNLQMTSLGLNSCKLNGIRFPYAKIYQELEWVSWVGANLYRTELGTMNGCNLRGADLRGAQLRASKGTNFVAANMKRVVFIGDNLIFHACNFKHARMHSVKMNDAKFTACDFRFADMREIELKHSFLQRARFHHANLYGADFEGARLTQADLRNTDLNRANLADADLTLAHLEGADLRQATLTNADFTHAFYDASTQWPSGFQPQNAHLRTSDRAIFNYAGINLAGASLQGFDFSKMRLSGACFDQADLTSCDFGGSVLTGASFFKANLHGANFAYADLTEASMSEANIRLADLQAAGLETVRFVGATGFPSASWPMGYDNYNFSKLAKPPKLDKAALHDVDANVADIRTHLPRPQVHEPEPLAEPLTFKLYPDTPDDDSWSLRFWRRMSDSDVIALIYLSQHTLRLSDDIGNEIARLSWERPFTAHLSVWLISSDALELTLTLRHRGENSRNGLRLKAMLPQTCVSADVPLQQLEAPYIAADTFAQIWAWVSFNHELHGRSLSGQLDLTSLHA